jgi:hypothetical protein
MSHFLFYKKTTPILLAASAPMSPKTVKFHDQQSQQAMFAYPNAQQPQHQQQQSPISAYHRSGSEQARPATHQQPPPQMTQSMYAQHPADKFRGTQLGAGRGGAFTAYTPPQQQSHHSLQQAKLQFINIILYL